MGKKDKNDGKKAEMEDVRKGQKLQAIILADSFKKTFRPLTCETPKALLPLANVPMIMYTIEFLAQNGVEEIFIFCVKHTERMERYVNSLFLPANLTVRCLTSTTCLTQGDALREIDAMNLIRSDPFILINGDVVSNMNLGKAIAYHKERKRMDSNAIMTVVMKEITSHAGLRAISDDLVVGLDSKSSQIVLFDDKISQSSIHLPRQISFEHSSIDLRMDLLDCQIDICSPELLLQFSDNFDYQEIRKHFIQGEAVNWELGEHLYAYIIKSEYAARVHDPRTYDYVSRDIINRWVHPMVPDAHLLADFSYTQQKHFVYKENDVKIARSARVGKCVVLARGTVLEDGVEVSNCVIGPNCTIKRGAKLCHCHIWENVVVESNAVIKHSIVGDRCIIREGASIGRGSLLSNGVVIGKNVIIPDYSRICNKRNSACSDDNESDDDDDDDDDKSIVNDEARDDYDTETVGVDGVGYVWVSDHAELGADFGFEDDSDDDLDSESPKKHAVMCGSGRVEALWATSIGCKEQENWKHRLWNSVDKPVEEDDTDDDFDDTDSGEGAEAGRDGMPNEAKVDSFQASVSEWVEAGHAQNDSADNLLLEIKGLKFAQNKEYVDCIRGLVPALLRIIMAEFEKTSSSTMKLVEIFKSFLDTGKWGYLLLASLIQDQTEEMCVIESLAEYVLKEGPDHPMYVTFRFLLQMLYDSELLSDEVIIEWADDAAKAEVSDDDPLKILALEPQVQEFISWLQEDEDDDDDDDDDSD